MNHRAPDNEPLMACEDLVIGYRGKALLPPISLTLRRGSFTVVVGRNGSGKSTCFKTLLGLTPPVSGRIWMAPQCRQRAYAPQLSALDPILPLRAWEIVQWGRLSGWNFLRPKLSREDHRIVERSLELAGATNIAARPYRELSEGQKQRVLLARVLATQSDVIFLDEPTAAMDAVAETETIRCLAELSHNQGLAVVVVSHHFRIPAAYASTLLFLDREAPAVVAGPPRDVFAHPAFRHQYGDEEGLKVQERPNAH